MCQVLPYETRFKETMIRTVREVYDEYGFTWEANGYHHDLYDVNDHYMARGGMFWVVLDGESLVGCAGVLIHGSECELHRMYLLKAYRGRGLGRRLLDVALEYCRQQGAQRMRAWSDVKLSSGHRLYERAGFVRAGDRICDDPDDSHEYGFVKEPL